MHSVDCGLVAKARAGDKRAFGQLILRHRPVLETLCRRALCDDELAEDAAQEAVIVALTSLDRLREPDRFGSWLVGIGLNICRQWLRPARRRQWSWQPILSDGADVEDLGPSPSEVSERAELTRIVRHAVSGLPPGQRVAVARFYFQDLSYRQAADDLGIPVTALKARLHKARKRLSEQLSPNEGDAIVPRQQGIRMQVLDVHRLAEPDGDVHIVMLGETDGDRLLPIWVGPYEATGIAIAMTETPLPRPFTWQLTAHLLDASQATISEVQIARIEDGTFYAEIQLETRGDRRTVDARPSDAINLALAVGAPITTVEAVLTAARKHGERVPDHSPEAVRRQTATDARGIVAGVLGTLPHKGR
jgi:RNA polymerase sigma factor (sigma-70 family)